MVSHETIGGSGSPLVRGLDAMVVNVVEGCTWMTTQYIEALRVVLGYHFGLLSVDMEMIATEIAQLAQKAESAGDVVYQQAFTGWYASVCRGLRNGVYQVPDSTVRAVLIGSAKV